MKYFLLIAAVAALVGSVQAKSLPAKPTAGCCDGGACCRMQKACCAGAHK
jgi:hypothetical protein